MPGALKAKVGGVWVPTAGVLPDHDHDDRYLRRTQGGAEPVSAVPATTGTVTLNLLTASVWTMTPTGNVTLAVTNPAPSGQASTVTLIVTGHATTNYTLTPPAGTIWVPSPVTSMKSGKATVYTLLTTNGGATWYISAAQQA